MISRPLGGGRRGVKAGPIDSLHTKWRGGGAAWNDFSSDPFDFDLSKTID